MHRLLIRLFGIFQVSLDNRILSGFESNKVRALLAYLAMVPRQSHPRETLLGLMWSEQPDHLARRNLSQALYNLRQVIGDAGTTPFLQIERGSIRIDHQANYWLDVETFCKLLRTVADHRHPSLADCNPCMHQLEQAVSLYSGPFLEDLVLHDCPSFELWSLTKREQYHQAATGACYRLATCYEQQNDYEQAYLYLWRAIELSPGMEMAHRQLMHLLMRQGRRADAMTQYRTCRRMLALEFDALPSEETEQLYHQLCTGKAPRPS